MVVLSQHPRLTMKHCTRCNLDKEDNQFPYDKRRGNFTTPCKECRKPIVRVATKRWRKESTDNYKLSTKKTKMKTKYGLTLNQLEELWISQDGKCGICTQPIPLDSPMKATKPHVDHNHVTGAVRGLLCLTCNTGIGMFGDSPELLSVAQTYLLRGTSTVKGDAEAVPVSTLMTETIH